MVLNGYRFIVSVSSIKIVKTHTFEVHESNGIMKFKLFFSFLFLYTTQLIAKEGMWLPFLLEQMNQKEMRQMGLKIKAKDIYDVSEGSLKDAVVIFGGGCTGEVISNKGLVLTNHHCGYSAVQALSSVEHNYLKNGFWAKSHSEEIPCSGLSVTFIVRIDDVTQEVRSVMDAQLADTTQNRLVLAKIAEIEKRVKAETGYETLIKSFFYDNEYYLFLMEKFTDIRLVGFPPNGIGKFGGDADNWAWPRHTGDFGVFRIYANKDNKPSAYQKENIPFTPRRYFKLNIEGIQEGDFSWVYGFPGRTSEYLTSDGVEEVMETLDPLRIAIRDKRLEIMNADMKKDENIFLQYAAKQAGIANYYKKWKGELLGLQRNQAIKKKEKQEEEFMLWVNQEEDRKAKYGHVLSALQEAYKRQLPYVKKNELINEAVWASEVLKQGSLLQDIYKAVDTINDLHLLNTYAKKLSDFYRSIHKPTDYKIANELMAIYVKQTDQDSFQVLSKLPSIYEESLIADSVHLITIIQLPNKEAVKDRIRNDVAYKTYSYFEQVQKKNMLELKAGQLKMNALYQQYIRGLQEFNEGKPFYPDANSTLRVTYGKIEGNQPQDGMTYTYQTTLDGAIDKNASVPQEFPLPEKLHTLYEQKDYGDYAITDASGKKTVPLAFLASNHTTGGNSGSPVLNAYGELIGTNFDRIWEGTMSDIMYDSQLCRNVALDIRYTLFIIEKLGEARWLIDEMDIVK